MPAKRKLNDNDCPEAGAPASPSVAASTPAPPATETTATEPAVAPKELGFAGLGLEPRLLRGIRDQKWSIPQPIQAQAIPLALEGKDILARSGTGTGKTAAYLLPILDSTLKRNQRDTSCLILCPTKELASQVTAVAKSLAKHCGDSIRVQNIAGKESAVVQRAQLAEFPNIVVATPARASVNVNNGALSLKNLAHLVIDECDLIFSYGYKEELESLKQTMGGAHVQTFLSSATLNPDTLALTGLFLRDPVIIKAENQKNSHLVKQYALRCGEDEKFLLIYALFLLKLIKGKTICFVANVERSYRVKLFLEQIGVKSCVLNSELPLASRIHIVEEFNKGVYDILIASDENEILGPRQKDDKPIAKKARNAESGAKDSGVARGIDFLNVMNILNFDLPSSHTAYFHRIGRCARAGKSGTAISFVIPKDKYRRHKPTSTPEVEHDEEVLVEIEKNQKEGHKVEDFGFDMTKLEPFRYRFGDALRAVTKIAVREARVKELRTELLKSQKLSRYFEENPETAQQLRHDQNLNHPARIQAHLKHVPDYLLPGGRKAEDIGFVGMEKERTRSGRVVKRKSRVVRSKNGKVDPLKTFNKKGRGKK